MGVEENAGHQRSNAVDLWLSTGGTSLAQPRHALGTTYGRTSLPPYGRRHGIGDCRKTGNKSAPVGPCRRRAISGGAAMVYGHNETDVALDQKRHEVEDRLARETRIGWPTLSAIAVLIAIGAVIGVYLFFHTGPGR
jgi:hypothetical protein